MYKESLMQVSRTLQKDIFFSLKAQIAQAKMNLYLSLPVHLGVALHISELSV